MLTSFENCFIKFDRFCLEYYLPKTTDGTSIRRSRSISQSFKNLFRSSSKKRGKGTKTDALADFNDGKTFTFVD